MTKSRGETRLREPDVLKRLRVYNESRARMGEGADTLCVDAAKEIASLRATLRAKSIFRVKEIATLRAKVTELSDEAYEYAEELQAARADVERRVKEIAHLKLAAEKADRESAS